MIIDSDLIKLYNEGNSPYEISRILNTYPNKVRRRLKKLGVELRDKSEAQKIALEKGISVIPTLGRKRTDVEKLKISKGLSKNWEDITSEKYEERCNKARERWNNLSDIDKEKMRQRALVEIQRASKEGSKLEKYLRSILKQNGYNALYHIDNLVTGNKLEVDMYIPALKAIIEVDGPSHFEPIWGEEKLRKQIKSDMEKNGLVLGKGFVMIRIKHLHYNLTYANKDKLKQSILGVLKNIEDNYPEESNRYIEIEL
jgi:very-short-patch-repair endonuclease